MHEFYICYLGDLGPSNLGIPSKMKVNERVRGGEWDFQADFMLGVKCDAITKISMKYDV